jgi:hypothetical protein
MPTYCVVCAHKIPPTRDEHFCSDRCYYAFNAPTPEGQAIRDRYEADLATVHTVALERRAEQRNEEYLWGYYGPPTDPRGD